MRAGVRLIVALGLVSVAGACSGGYPLPPTRCDEWCDATKGGTCERYYDPAGCVSSCEAGHIAAVEVCDSKLEDVIACFRRHPDAVDAQCTGATPPCGAEGQALGDCVAYHYLTTGSFR